jgi:hypothetical protein
MAALDDSYHLPGARLTRSEFEVTLRLDQASSGCRARLPKVSGI